MKFKFDENNITQVEFPVLAQSHHEPSEHFAKSSELRRNQGIIQLGFLGKKSMWEYQILFTQGQIATLEFIKSNQLEILKSLFEYTKNKLYPEHIGYIGYDETSFPPLNKISNLRKSLGVNFITLYIEEKLNSNYFALTCDFSGDFEHGVNIIMNRTHILGWEENLGNDLILRY